MRGNFKSGDVVRCIDPCSSSQVRAGTLVLGEKYTISSTDSWRVRLEGFDMIFNQCRFELVSRMPLDIGRNTRLVLNKENVGQRYTVELASSDFRKVQVASISLGFVKEYHFVQVEPLSGRLEIIDGAQVLGVKEGW